MRIASLHGSIVLLHRTKILTIINVAHLLHLLENGSCLLAYIYHVFAGLRIARGRLCGCSPGVSTGMVNFHIFLGDAVIHGFMVCQC